jgi:hypothetical protein
MNTYPITHEIRNNEVQIIKIIIQNNRYHLKLIYENYKYNPDNKNLQPTQKRKQKGPPLPILGQKFFFFNLRPLNGLLCQPRVIMIMVKSVK